VKVSRVIEAPPERAWTRLARYDAWTGWGISIREVRVDGDVVTSGDRGRVRTALGPWLPFEITEVVEGRSWSWRVAGVEATGHEVVPHRDGCRVVFSAPWWAAPYAPVMRRALAILARELEQV